MTASKPAETSDTAVKASPKPAETATPQTTTAQTTTSQTTVDQNTVAQTSAIPPVPVAPPVKPITPPVLPKPVPVVKAPQAKTAQTQPTKTQPTTKTNDKTATTTPAAAKTPVPATAAKTATTPPATKAPPIPATPAVAPRGGGAVATSENRIPRRSDYRISLGSFGTRGTAENQTAGVGALGYRVHPIDLGTQYVAQVGPFADEATARRALADIQRAYPNAVLFQPISETKTTTATAPSTAPDNTDTAAAPTRRSRRSARTAETQIPDRTATSSDSAVKRTASAPSGPTYLQVGSFKYVESAQKLVTVLRDNNFAPTVNNPPDSRTTVLVGPYSGDALLRAEARLDSAGLGHFRVK